MGIVKDIAKASDWMSSALISSGYNADYSPGSVKAVERFFVEHAPDGQVRADGLLAEGLGSRLFGLGAYVGEVLRRSLGGEWIGDDSDADAEINVTLRLADGSLVWPVQRVIKRVQEGPDESITAYCAVLGLDVTVFDAPRKRGLLRRR